MAQPTDLTSRVFGDLQVLSRAANSRHGKAMWDCLCMLCGREKTILAVTMIRGESTSCGCRRVTVAKRNFTKHGLRAGGRLPHGYHSWADMIQRCTNPNNQGFKRYGGRGITVCSRWLGDFGAFYADMGEAPAGMSIDRIDNEGNYEPGNCRWATPKQQSVNSTRPIPLTVDGVTKNVTEWMADRGLAASAFHSRIAGGWSIDDAVRTPKLNYWSRQRVRTK